MNNKDILEQVRTLKHEFGILSGKKPNDPINVFKLKYVNKTLKAANDVLGDENLMRILKSFQRKICLLIAMF